MTRFHPHMIAAAITFALLLIGNSLMAGGAAVWTGQIEIGGYDGKR